MKVEIFWDEAGTALQEEINEWLDKNKTIYIYFVKQSVNQDGTTISIWYK